MHGVLKRGERFPAPSVRYDPHAPPATRESAFAAARESNDGFSWSEGGKTFVAWRKGDTVNTMDVSIAIDSGYVANNAMSSITQFRGLCVYPTCPSGDLPVEIASAGSVFTCDARTAEIHTVSVRPHGSMYCDLVFNSEGRVATYAAGIRGVVTHSGDPKKPVSVTRDAGSHTVLHHVMRVVARECTGSVSLVGFQGMPLCKFNVPGAAPTTCVVTPDRIVIIPVSLATADIGASARCVIIAGVTVRDGTMTVVVPDKPYVCTSLPPAFTTSVPLSVHTLGEFDDVVRGVVARTESAREDIPDAGDASSGARADASSSARGSASSGSPGSFEPAVFVACDVATPPPFAARGIRFGRRFGESALSTVLPLPAGLMVCTEAVLGLPPAVDVPVSSHRGMNVVVISDAPLVGSAVERLNWCVVVVVTNKADLTAVDVSGAVSIRGPMGATVFYRGGKYFFATGVEVPGLIPPGVSFGDEIAIDFDEFLSEPPVYHCPRVVPAGGDLVWFDGDMVPIDVATSVFCGRLTSVVDMYTARMLLAQMSYLLSGPEFSRACADFAGKVRDAVEAVSGRHSFQLDSRGYPIVAASTVSPRASRRALERHVRGLLRLIAGAVCDGSGTRADAVGSTRHTARVLSIRASAQAVQDFTRDDVMDLVDRQKTHAVMVVSPDGFIGDVVAALRSDAPLPRVEIDGRLPFLDQATVADLIGGNYSGSEDPRSLRVCASTYTDDEIANRLLAVLVDKFVSLLSGPDAGLVSRMKALTVEDDSSDYALTLAMSMLAESGCDDRERAREIAYRIVAVFEGLAEVTADDGVSPFKMYYPLFGAGGHPFDGLVSASVPACGSWPDLASDKDAVTFMALFRMFARDESGGSDVRDPVYAWAMICLLLGAAEHLAPGGIHPGSTVDTTIKGLLLRVALVCASTAVTVFAPGYALFSRPTPFVALPKTGLEYDVFVRIVKAFKTTSWDASTVHRVVANIFAQHAWRCVLSDAVAESARRAPVVPSGLPAGFVNDVAYAIVTTGGNLPLDCALNFADKMRQMPSVPNMRGMRAMMRLVDGLVSAANGTLPGGISKAARLEAVRCALGTLVKRGAFGDDIRAARENAVRILEPVIGGCMPLADVVRRGELPPWLMRIVCTQDTAFAYDALCGQSLLAAMTAKDPPDQAVELVCTPEAEEAFERHMLAVGGWSIARERPVDWLDHVDDTIAAIVKFAATLSDDWVRDNVSNVDIPREDTRPELVRRVARGGGSDALLAIAAGVDGMTGDVVPRGFMELFGDVDPDAVLRSCVSAMLPVFRSHENAIAAGTNAVLSFVGWE